MPAITIPSTPAGMTFLATFDRIWNELHEARFAKTGEPCDLACCARPNSVIASPAKKRAA